MMVALVGDALTITDAEKSVTMHFDGSEFVITASADVDAIVIKIGDERIRMETDRVRIDGGGRVEVHADDVTRIDAGGSGYTFMPTRWVAYFPTFVTGHLRAPPEHPDSGGLSYTIDDAGAWEYYLNEWLARFPAAEV